MRTPLIAPSSHLALPFFGPEHQALGRDIAAWAPLQQVDESDDRVACKQWTRLLGDAGWLRYCVPAEFGGALDRLDSRALVILRETLAFHSPLADFAMAMAGLGSGAITLAGTPAQQAAYLPAVARGDKLAAFALSEPDAGSDAGAMTTVAQHHPSTGASGQSDGYVLNGVKTWISNGGIADFYCVFAKTDAQAGTRGISAFIADAGTKGLDDSEHITVMAPHPLATLRFTDCALDASAQLGELGGGFKLAMRTLDIFRASVAGAALGMARRALAEAVAFAQARPMFGQKLADFQLTQVKLGDMAALVESAAMLTYRAAWLRDGGQPFTSAAAMAKLTATETAQTVIDRALQMFGGRGVVQGEIVERLYREIRALRIYEGASEVQKLIIGRELLK